MAYETINAALKAEDFTPLAEHLEQTPQTFFGSAKPVLHFHCSDARLSVSMADLATQPDFAALGNIEGGVNGRAAPVMIEDIEVWVTSRHLTLYSNTKSHGIQIYYPTITIHAQEGSAVLLELNLSDANTADEDLEFLQLRIVPSTALSTHYDTDSAHANGQMNGDSSPSVVKALYDAISACQELNPDPNPEGDDDEERGMGSGFDETAPGATGWITSENMADFMDEDGNFRMPEGTTVIGGEVEVDGADEGASSLGAGAGRRRNADEVDAEDGANDDAKWQRTG